MADIKRIMSKKKPTAKDTLTVLLYDLTQKQAGKEGVNQEQYKDLVLRLSNQERQEHEKNANLYNFLFSLPDRLSDQEKHTALLIQFLTACLHREATLFHAEYIKPELIYNFIDNISENIREINGYNFLISCLEEYTPGSNIKRLYVKTDDINEELEQLKNVSEDLQPEIETDPNLSPFLNFIKTGYFSYNVMLADNVKEQIKAAVLNDLEGFSNMGTIEYIRYLMERAKED